MPYAHNFRRAPELSREGFRKVAEDAKTILERALEMGIRIAGPMGSGKPEITNNTIAFNGLKVCGHKFFDFGDPWPTDDAEGVSNDDPIAEAPYFSGEYLKTRTCHGGSCAAEPFVLDRVFMEKHWSQLEAGGFFCKCVTLFKPYDLMVTAVLLRAKEHLSNEIFLSVQDGGENGYEDAKRLCRELFGWPRHFELESKESEVV